MLFGFCVFVFIYFLLLRSYITRHKNHLMSLKALAQTGNNWGALFGSAHFPHHAQSVQHLAVLILIQESALTFETWKMKGFSGKQSETICCELMQISSSVIFYLGCFVLTHKWQRFIKHTCFPYYVIVQIDITELATGKWYFTSNFPLIIVLFLHTDVKWTIKSSELLTVCEMNK